MQGNINYLAELLMACQSKSIDDYMKEQIEIHELALISSFYYLKNNNEVKFQVSLINKKYNISLDSEYLSRRWEKFYSRKNKAKFDNNIKNIIIKRDAMKCSYCDYCDKEIQVHHVIPQAKHGPTSQYNLVTACSICNLSIGNNICLPKNWEILHPESKWVSQAGP